MRVNCFLDHTDLCKKRRKKHTHTQRKQNVYQKSKTEGFKKERNTKKQILLESKPNKKKSIYTESCWLYLLWILFLFFFYTKCVEIAAKQRRKNKPRYIKQKEKYASKHVVWSRREYTRERERERKVIEERAYILNRFQSWAEANRIWHERKRKEMVPETVEKRLI